MNIKRFKIILILFISCKINAQTVDFAMSTLLQLNIEKTGFSHCSEFIKYSNFHRLFQFEETCYYKCHFEESNSDSIIVVAENYPVNSYSKEITYYEVRIYQYYHDLKVANSDYTVLIRELKLEFKSHPELFNSEMPGTFLNYQLKDSSNILKMNCTDNVSRFYDIKSSYIFGTIKTNLECSKEIYKITLTISGGLLTEPGKP
jgi:hypothetical protein